ncbi:glycosyltransferase family 9 protein, partial [bacterium]|nr:glycosyltransferase family 9 protein [bacterium]
MTGIRLPERPKFLIARSDMLGDLITATALIAPLIEAYPGARVYFLCRPECASLVMAIPGVEGVVEDTQAYDGRVGSPEFSDVLHRVISHRFDVMINLWEHPRYAKLAKMAGIPIRIGHAIGWTNRWCHTHRVHLNYQDYHRHKVAMNLATLHPLGISVADAPLALSVSDSVRHDLTVRWPVIAGPYRVLAVDAGAKVKCLTDDELVPVITELLAMESTPVLLVGHSIANASDSTLAWMSAQERLIDLTGRTSLLDVVAILTHSRYFVGPDSGISHIAAAVGCPSLVIYRTRTQNAFHWAPWLSPHVILKQQNRCMDHCRPLSCSQCTRTVITPSAVSYYVGHLLSGSDGSDGTLSSQYAYWERVGHQAAIFCDDDQFLAVKNGCPTEWQPIHLRPTDSMVSLKTQLVDRNINLVICPGHIPIKLRLACIWASNFSHFLPMIRRHS